MTPSTVLLGLEWPDVDPAGRDFDPVPLRAGLLARLESTPVRDDDDRERVADTIDRVFVGACGAWAAGWAWTATEPGHGGPVRSWCCPDDSVAQEDETDLGPTVDRAIAALGELHAFLTELAARFTALRKETAGMPVEPAVEHAAARLLPFVLEQTTGADAWHGTFGRVLCWWLTSAGHAPWRVEQAVEKVIRGRFESWMAPSPTAAAAACRELGEAVSAAARTPVTTSDALAAWLSIRGSAFSYEREVRPTPVAADAHLRWIEGPERARDPARAARMAEALVWVREQARRGVPLDFAGLARAQGLVLGEPVGFRTGEAFAKGGRERYGLTPETPARFDACLTEAGSPEPAPRRAARVYLDVCFFHPFPDGNARAARLALEWVLTREGLGLHAVEPLFVLSRSASDRTGAYLFADAVAHLCGPVG